MTYSGEYGGCVKRTFKGDGKNWIAGAILKPEDVMGWPLANRKALHDGGKVDWYGPPVAAEQVAREAGKPAPERKTTSQPAEKKEKAVAPVKPAAPAAARRRR